MQNLKILMSAYACEPDRGSEPGVGWRWVLETAALGHEVWVITRAKNAANIAKGLTVENRHAQGRHPHSQHALDNLHFTYFDLPLWARWWKRGNFGVHLYYLLWQWGAYRQARKLHQQANFDAVHHITFGVTRQPSFMGRLGIPFILGPLGGGERAPMAARKYISRRGHIKEVLRDGVNWVARFDPWVRQMYAQASLILMRTPQSLAWLPAQYHDKALCMPEIGVEARPLPPASTSATATKADAAAPEKIETAHKTLHILYVGRFIYWKGMDLGLHAIANLRARGIPVRLTMIGQGPDKRRWQQLAARLRLLHCLTWVPWMKQQDLLQAYQTFDALLFPSLHDSGGTVVLESMTNGLPVVCLDLGGPAQMINSSCGRVIPVVDRDAAEIIEALADALAELAINPELLAQLRRGAQQRAQDFAWNKLIGQVWGSHGSGCKAVAAHISEAGAYVSA